MIKIEDKTQIEKYYKKFPLDDYFGFDIKPFTSIIQFEYDELIMAEGEEPEYLYYLIEGDAKLFLTHDNGRITLINFLSIYNFDNPTKEVVDHLMQTQNEVVYGSEWYAGDHAAFAFRGIPCMVLSSSDLFEGGLDNTHTMRDTLDTVDLSQIELAVNYINQMVDLYK